MKADRASAVMRTLNPGEVKPKGIDCSHYDREICVVRRHVYVPRMKPLLLALFAVHHLGDRWLAIAPIERPPGRMFDRQELRAADSNELVADQRPAIERARPGRLRERAPAHKSCRASVRLVLDPR